jgi:Skp family chaperone for outer membrane proteins
MRRIPASTVLLGPALAVAIGALVLLGGRVGAAADPGQSLEPRTFKPPRIAVVDISDVFENYSKKKDIESQLEAQIKVEEDKFREKENALKATIEELKNVQEGSEKYQQLVLKKTKFELELKNRQKELLNEFQEKQASALKEIKNEITGEIEKYAVAMEIDMVLEKKVAAEGKGNLRSVHWPIVHYVRPELEITDDIVKRLNARYSKPGAPAASTGGAEPKAKK